jgi:hypothetical protein
MRNGKSPVLLQSLSLSVYLMSDLISLSNSSGSNGVETYSLQPAASARSRYWSAPYAETATIGTAAKFLSSRILRVAASPSSSGISTSMMIKSGRLLSAAMMARFPFSASTTRNPFFWSQVLSSNRVSSKSSTTRIVRRASFRLLGSADTMLVSVGRGGGCRPSGHGRSW